MASQVNQTDAVKDDLQRRWKSDPLSSFMDDAQHNAYATTVNLRNEYGSFTAIDGLFCRMIENLNQTTRYFAGFFLIRTHSSFRGGVHLCLSGQVTEAYMVLRGCLENALYGFYLADDVNRQEKWLRRHESEDTKRKVRDEFKIGKIKAYLKGRDSKLGEIVDSLYERTIDLGAHPNERSIWPQIETKSDENRTEVIANYFNCGDRPHRLCMKSSVQVAICSLDIFSHIYSERFRILGIDVALNQIRQGF